MQFWLGREGRDEVDGGLRVQSKVAGGGNNRLTVSVENPLGL